LAVNFIHKDVVMRRPNSPTIPSLAGKPAQTPGSDAVSVDDALAFAVKLQQQGCIEAAAELYTRILEQLPDHADALNFLGVARFQSGDAQAALELIGRAIEIKPDLAGAYNNLGNVLARLDRPAEAARAYQRVIELEPCNADAHNNLGALLRATGNAAEAEPVLRRALELAPDNADALHNLGNVLAQLQRMNEAADMFARAIELRPYDGKSYHRLGSGLYGLRREQEAAKVFQCWLKVDPENEEARHMVAAATGNAVPERASDGCVKAIFDRMAETFDCHLDKLDYRAPQLLAGRVAEVFGPGQGKLDVLDAGCGTGLCGLWLKAWAHHLVGVDLSSQMIEKARLRKIYDDLLVSELTSYLSTHPAAHDLVISADTLCYFGDLKTIIAATACSLRRGGCFGFTVELAGAPDASDGYSLGFHGRYNHRRSYVLESLELAGLRPISIDDEHLRIEREEPVRGLVVMAVKSDA
jgi:predicted TPR repeat methyltransferase